MTKLDDTIESLARGSAIVAAIGAIRDALEPYVFRVRSEAALQAQVAVVLAPVAGMHIDTEVRRNGGRFDMLVRYTMPGQFYPPAVVLELKLHGAPAPVERQAQRYAMMDEVDAVGVVTTSRRLAGGLGGMSDLGGKPFFVVAVRTT